MHFIVVVIAIFVIFCTFGHHRCVHAGHGTNIQYIHNNDNNNLDARNAAAGSSSSGEDTEVIDTIGDDQVQLEENVLGSGHEQVPTLAQVLAERGKPGLPAAAQPPDSQARSQQQPPAPPSSPPPNQQQEQQQQQRRVRRPQRRRIIKPNEETGGGAAGGDIANDDDAAASSSPPDESINPDTTNFFNIDISKQLPGENSEIPHQRRRNNNNFNDDAAGIMNRFGTFPANRIMNNNNNNNNRIMMRFPSQNNEAGGGGLPPPPSFNRLRNSQFNNENNFNPMMSGGFNNRMPLPPSSMLPQMRPSIPSPMFSPMMMSPGGALNGTMKTLFAVNFRRDFDRCNPMNKNSTFQWQKKPGLILDNALFLMGSNVNNDELGVVDMVTMPFHNYIAKHDKRREQIGLPSFARTEAALQFNFAAAAAQTSSADGGDSGHGARLTCNTSQVLTLRTRFTTQVFNVKRHRFPQPEEVRNVNDDLRLAHGGVALSANGGEFLFEIVATNTAIWGIYERTLAATRANSQSAAAFSVVKRFGGRKELAPPSFNFPTQTMTAAVDDGAGDSAAFAMHSMPIIAAALQYDGTQRLVNFFLYGQLVWSIGDFGSALPADMFGGVLVYQSEGVAPAVSSALLFQDFSFNYFIRQTLDWGDPNPLPPAAPTAAGNDTTTAAPVSATQHLHGLVQLETVQGAYVEGTTFFDTQALRSNVIREWARL